MMAPSVVMRDGEVELVLGSAGSNRIRSALLQTIVGVVDHGMSARAAVDAPRVHYEDGVFYSEPGIDLDELSGWDTPVGGENAPAATAGMAPTPAAVKDTRIVRFHSLNLFFGGVQAVQRSGEGLTGAGDPRRGGVAVSS